VIGWMEMWSSGIVGIVVFVVDVSSMYRSPDLAVCFGHVYVYR